MSNRFVKTIHSNRSYCKLIPERVFNRTWCSVAAGIGTLQESPTTKRFYPDQIVSNTIPQPSNIATEKEKDDFNSVFKSIVHDLTDCHEKIPEATNYYVDTLNANVFANKQATGLIAVTAYKAFSLPEKLTPQNIFLANILGWCVNFMISSSQVIVDITDRSETHNGLPCWYRNSNVGLLAIVDAVFIERSPYIILKKYFSRDNIYLDAVEWIHDVTVKSTNGRALDMLNTKNGRQHLGSFTKQRFDILAKYRTTYTTLLSPIVLALKFARRNDDTLHNQVTSIIFDLGNYCHAQNNISDCFGDPLLTGRTGRDVQEGKCTWLIVKALEKATQRQRGILKTHYGRENFESVLEIKSLYKELRLFEEFLTYEEDSYNSLSKRISEMPDEFPKEYFFKFLNTFYTGSVPLQRLTQH